MLLTIAALAAAAGAPPPGLDAQATRTIQDAIMTFDKAEAHPRLHGPRRAKSLGKLAPLFSFADYPPDALRAEKQGDVVVRLTANPQGRVSACKVVRSAKTPSLDEATCRIFIERAEFRPAVDRHGNPVADRSVQHVSWRLKEDDGDFSLPPEPAQPFASTTVIASYDFDDATASTCLVSAPLAPPALVRDACNELRPIAVDFAKAQQLTGPHRLNVVTRVTPITAVPATPASGTEGGGAEALLTVSGAGIVLGCSPLGSTDPIDTAVLCARAGRVQFLPVHAGAPSHGDRFALVSQTVAVERLPSP